MGLLEMKRQDLIELYQLIELYERTYKEDWGEWKKGVKRKYEKITREKIKEARNPRGGGRKRKYSKEENEKILEGYQQKKSLRQIAREAGCSVGHVQDVIREEREEKGKVYGN